jgi:hypothetical protein
MGDHMVPPIINLIYKWRINKMNTYEMKIIFDNTIPQLTEVIESKMHELDIYAEIVNGVKRELEKDFTIRNISKNEINGWYSIDFDINDGYSIGIWTNGMYRMNTVIVSLDEKYVFVDVDHLPLPRAIIGELRVHYNSNEPFTCDEEVRNSDDEFVNASWPKVVSAVHTVINKMNEKIL